MTGAQVDALAGESGALQPSGVCVVPGPSDAGVLLLCDHASNALPPDYGTLGLPAREFERHIAWDPGAAAVVHDLAAALEAPAVLSEFSRLLIDCNRGADDPTLVMRLSDGTVIPGNRAIDADEIAKRVVCYHRPYHDAIARQIDAMLEAGPPPVILSIHSFTDFWKGVPRPWHAGVLWDRDPRLSDILLRGLRADSRLVVGDNEPYSGRLHGDTLWQHGTSRGLAHAIVEIRQDLLRLPGAARAWSQRLAGLVKTALADEGLRADLHVIRHYSSKDCPQR
jgi:predicted N-formylglutamate amidohydrolase